MGNAHRHLEEACCSTPETNCLQTVQISFCFLDDLREYRQLALEPSDLFDGLRVRLRGRGSLRSQRLALKRVSQPGHCPQTAFGFAVAIPGIEVKLSTPRQALRSALIRAGTHQSFFDAVKACFNVPLVPGHAAGVSEPHESQLDSHRDGHGNEVDDHLLINEFVILSSLGPVDPNDGLLWCVLDRSARTPLATKRVLSEQGIQSCRRRRLGLSCVAVW